MLWQLARDPELLDLVSTELCPLSLLASPGSPLFLPLRLLPGVFLRNLDIEEVKILRLGAVNIKPPVTDKLLLVEHGPIWTEEVELDKDPVPGVRTHMVQLTVGLGVGIVSLQRGWGKLVKQVLIQANEIVCLPQQAEPHRGRKCPELKEKWGSPRLEYPEHASATYQSLIPAVFD